MLTALGWTLILWARNSPSKKLPVEDLLDAGPEKNHDGEPPQTCPRQPLFLRGVSPEKRQAQQGEKNQERVVRHLRKAPEHMAVPSARINRRRESRISMSGSPATNLRRDGKGTNILSPKSIAFQDESNGGGEISI